MNEQPPNTQALPAGTRLEEFVIERVLGAGGFGITYLARDVSLGRQVVIKENLPVQFCFRDTRSLTVSPRHTSGEDLENFQWSLENFSRESAMLASLDHPGIVRVHRSFQAFGTAYFVMPFVEGMALDELAKKRGDRSFTEEELASLLKETLSALGYLHDRGIYHRDIKPGNILITSEGKPVLIDFGSARQRLSERSMTVVESAGYTPFEQLQSRGNVGPWSDLYALAATIVKVMTGESPPKASDRTMGDPWQPLSGRAELIRRFSPLLLGTLDRALKLPIEERWQNAGDWQKALKSGKVPVVADATNKKALPDEEQKVAGKKRVWPKVVAALMIVGAASGWWLLRSAETDSPDQVVSESKWGGLVITSEPSGSDVMRGLKLLGKTPLELKGLLADSRWEGSLKKEDYEVAEISAEVISGETKLVPQIVLIPTPQKVIVTSEPSGAEVLEGDKLLGKTPLELKLQPVGTRVNYQLRIEGYVMQELKGEVLFGEALQLSANLVEKPKFEGSHEGDKREFEIAPGVKMTFCWCPPGEFMMGSPEGELGRGDDEVLHRVKLTKGFWMGKYEVTQKQWTAILGTNPSLYKGDNLPVETVSWHDAQEFLKKLNAKIGNTDGGQMALPTEAQWEYACRAGEQGPYSGGTIDEVAWYDDNSGVETHSVGSKKPNAWGLHDMLGNVLEWCSDRMGSYGVLRGGCWFNSSIYCRAAIRNFSNRSDAFNCHGFRVARSSVP